MAMALFDLLLTVGFTLRLIRLVTADYIGLWLIDSPLHSVRQWAGVRNDEGYPVTWRQKLWCGLRCPHCVGFWLGIGVLTSLYASGGPGDAAILWRYIAGAFTLSYVTGHTSARVD